MYSSIALALLSQVSAFGLITIRSGSLVQNSGVKVGSDGYLTISEGTDLDASIGADGKLVVGGESVGVDADGFLVVGGAKSPVFGREDLHLTADSSQGFNVCPNEGGKVGLPSAQCEDVVNVALRIVGDVVSSSALPINGSSTAYTSESTVESTIESTIEPTDSALPTSESSVPTTNNFGYTNNTTPTGFTNYTASHSTSVVEKTVVETVCTHETCTGVIPINGAARNTIFGGVVALAAALF